MQCLKCKEEGKESRVFVPTGSFSTEMAWQPFFDSEGHYHGHDPNTHTSEWSCSNGHLWIVSKLAECRNCDYGKDSSNLRWVDLPKTP